MNFFLARFDTSGRLEWTRGYGDGGHVAARGLALAPDGDLYVVGSMASSIRNGAEGRWEAKNLLLTTSTERAFIARLDPAGNAKWATFVDGMATATSVTLDADGHVYVGGSAGVVEVLGKPGNAVITVLSETGEPLWWRTVAEGRSAYVQGLAATSAGICAVGYRTTDSSAGSSKISGFLASYSSEGESQWSREVVADSSLLGIAGKVLLYGAAADADGSCYAAGGVSGILNFGPNRITAQEAPSTSAVAYTHTDAVVLKVDRRGEPAWAAHLAGGDASDFAHSVAVGPGGQLVVIGSFMGSARFGADTLALTYAPGEFNPRGLFVLALTADGKMLSGAQNQPESLMSSSAVTAAPDGTFYVTGQQSGSAIYGNVSVPNRGSNVFLARMRW